MTTHAQSPKRLHVEVSYPQRIELRVFKERPDWQYRALDSDRDPKIRGCRARCRLSGGLPTGVTPSGERPILLASVRESTVNFEEILSRSRASPTPSTWSSSTPGITFRDSGVDRKTASEAASRAVICPKSVGGQPPSERKEYLLPLGGQARKTVFSAFLRNGVRMRVAADRLAIWDGSSPMSATCSWATSCLPSRTSVSMVSIDRPRSPIVGPGGLSQLRDEDLCSLGGDWGVGCGLCRWPGRGAPSVRRDPSWYAPAESPPRCWARSPPPSHPPAGSARRPSCCLRE